ncbi:MAG: hypothetical protein JWM11_4100 [Planctomycetaceae bacterium]|nr:hypothetical protein [Planctomycetaceae bacterium]
MALYYATQQVTAQLSTQGENDYIVKVVLSGFAVSGLTTRLIRM